jgi:hypothetical protein
MENKKGERGNGDGSVWWMSEWLVAAKVGRVVAAELIVL